MTLMPREAWQPFTPRGVAGFAHATFTRLVLVQIAIALVVAVASVWFISSQWFPVITHAISGMPPSGVIRKGVATNSIPVPSRLAENRSLAVVLDLTGRGELGRVADLEVTLKSNAVDLCGVLGCATVNYPRGYIISFNRAELEPWWGAWHWPMAALFGVAVIAKLLASWWMIALFLAPLVKMVAFYCDRHVTLAGSFRVAAAALLPGAFVMAGGIVLHGLGAINLVQLALLYLLHILCGGVFAATAPLFLPRLRYKARNPFASPSEKNAAPSSAGRKSPFSPRNEN